MNRLNEIISYFPEVKEVSEIVPLTAGLINQTYKVETKDPGACDYILQCINHQVFQNVDVLQRNIECVTRHIRKKLEEAHETDINRKVLRFVSATRRKIISFRRRALLAHVRVHPRLANPRRSDTGVLVSCGAEVRRI